MDLILKNGLPHQIKGVNAVSDVFENINFESDAFYYSNPVLKFDKHQLLDNIKSVQNRNSISSEYSELNFIRDYLNLDVKMETGTGKTYVYASTIFELHKRFKINKFIVVVPSLPIKAGAQQFLEDPYVKKHFKDVCGYNAEIDLQVLESMKRNKGKQYFPSVVREFVSGSRQNANKIQVLLTNMALLTNSKMLTRDDYDSGVEDFFKPVDAIKATKPFVIIDEPHRFSKHQKSFNFIIEEFSPQCVIRYGATFPAKKISKASKKNKTKDYHNLVYNLNASDSFNQNLIKGIAKEHFEPLSKKNDKVKIASIKSKISAKFTFIQKDETPKHYVLTKGDSLSIISDQFEGISIQGIGKNLIELSNGQTKFSGEEFSTDIYSTSYQEQMLKLSIERHFETEKENFNRKFKIKTLSLFFIDDIHSYRFNEESGKEPYLKNIFEKLLLEKIEEILYSLSPVHDKDYIEYLEVSKQNLASCHSGYFSQDNSDSDEDIAKEINEILHDKKSLLSIRTKEGKINPRRFLFSKWTLKEGWDNPNVFTITKLRSSGSETSKLQEVGRGLRLPVDENGNRISNEEFKLNYIIDFTEADFAEQLIKEINEDLPKGFIITDEQIEKVAIKLKLTKNELFKKLLLNDYIDMDKNIITINSKEFFDNYPDFGKGVLPHKIINRNKIQEKKVQIRASAYSDLKDLWEAINHKYVIHYDRLEENDFFLNEIIEIWKDEVFTEVILESKREILTNNESGLMDLTLGGGVQYTIRKKIPYGEFLKQISKHTNIPINFLHKSLKEYSSTNNIEEDKINEFSAANFISKFVDWKTQNLAGRFKYSKSNLSLQSTALTNADGSPKKEITMGRIGTKFLKGEPTHKYLYDTYTFDSPLEKENLLAENIAEIVVYGKIPRSSISIPTITGQSYSPDFMYVIKKVNGDKILNVVVETKDVDRHSDIRKIEQVKIDCAKVFFKQLSIDGYKVEFHEQIRSKKIKQIIEDVLENEVK